MENWFKRLTYPLINRWGERKFESNFSKEPILVGGCARSGTTLLISVLSAHPAIYTFPKELCVFTKWRDDGNGNIKPKRIDRLNRKAIITRFPNEATRWCEKSAQNVRHFDKILDYYGEQVKLIHIVRDGRDVITSRHPNDPKKFWVKPSRWASDVSQGLEYKDHPKVYTIHYEDIVNNYDESVQNLFDFLSEEFHENLREYHKHADIREAPGWFHEVKAVHNKSIGRWQKVEYQDRYQEAQETPGFMETLERAGYI
ncbi:MAG: hypothetical protein MAGBODY4_00013 [Candidatus Marinimicrobia bacterium]|nr:hypothetical protein [Candidatus Neomarinimicrobiota bacterium]